MVSCCTIEYFTCRLLKLVGPLLYFSRRLQASTVLYFDGCQRARLNKLNYDQAIEGACVCVCVSNERTEANNERRIDEPTTQRRTNNEQRTDERRTDERRNERRRTTNERRRTTTNDERRTEAIGRIECVCVCVVCVSAPSLFSS